MASSFSHFPPFATSPHHPLLMTHYCDPFNLKHLGLAAEGANTYSLP